MANTETHKDLVGRLVEQAEQQRRPERIKVTSVLVRRSRNLHITTEDIIVVGIES